MEKWNFRDCTIVKLRKAFKLERVKNLPSLDLLLSSDFKETEIDR